MQPFSPGIWLLLLVWAALNPLQTMQTMQTRPTPKRLPEVPLRGRSLQKARREQLGSQHTGAGIHSSADPTTSILPLSEVPATDRLLTWPHWGGYDVRDASAATHTSSIGFDPRGAIVVGYRKVDPLITNRPDPFVNNRHSRDAFSRNRPAERDQDVFAENRPLSHPVSPDGALVVASGTAAQQHRYPEGDAEVDVFALNRPIPRQDPLAVNRPTQGPDAFSTNRPCSLPGCFRPCPAPPCWPADSLSTLPSLPAGASWSPVSGPYPSPVWARDPFPPLHPLGPADPFSTSRPQSTTPPKAPLP